MPNLFDDVPLAAPVSGGMFDDVDMEQAPAGKTFSERAIEPAKEIYGQPIYQPLLDKVPSWARPAVDAAINANPLASVEKGMRGVDALARGFIPGVVGAGAEALGANEAEADRIQRETQHAAHVAMNFPFLPSSTRVPRARVVPNVVREPSAVEAPPRAAGNLPEAAPVEQRPATVPAEPAVVEPQAPAPVESAAPDLFNRPAAQGVPPVKDGFVRVYHGGAPESRDGVGGRWVTPDEKYARGWAGETGEVSYVDIPKDSPLLKKSYEDAGTDQVAPYVHFEAPESIAKNLQPLEGKRAAATVFDDVPMEEPPARVTEHIPEAPNPFDDVPMVAKPAEVEAAAAPPVEDALPTKPKGRKPQSLGEYISTNGGLEKTGDTAAMDLPGYLVRKNGKSIDGFWRERLIEEGYLEPDPDGYASRDIRNELYDKLQREAAGEKQYSVHARAALEEREHYAAAKERQSELEYHRNAILEEAPDYGIDPKHIDKKDLDRAAELLHERVETDPMEALNRVYHENLETIPDEASGVVRGAGEVLDEAGKPRPDGNIEAARTRTGEVGAGAGEVGGWQAPQGARDKAAARAQEHLRDAFRDKLGEREANVTPIGTVSLRDAIGQLDFGHLKGAPKQVSRAFAARLRNVVGDTPVHYIRDDEMRRYEQKPEGQPASFGRWVGGKKAGSHEFILLNADAIGDIQQATHVTLHEGAHAAALKRLMVDQQALKSVRTLMDEIAPKLRKDAYALTNEHEFLSEVFGNHTLQQILHDTPAGVDLAARLGGKGKIATMWDAFVETVRRAIGLAPNMRNLLEAALQVGEKVTREPYRGTVSNRLEASMARKAGPAPGALREKLESEPTLGEKFATKIQDRMMPVKRVKEAAEREGGAPLPDELNTYQAEAVFHGRKNQRIDEFDNTRVKPLLKDIKSRELDLDEVGDFLQALNAPHRNKRMQRINADKSVGSGMTDAQAKDILDKVDASGKRADFDAVSKQVRKINQERLDLLVDSGLLSRQEANAWKVAEPFYAPFRGEMEGSAKSGSWMRRSMRSPESFQALGRKSKADNPLAYIIHQGKESIVRSEMNKVHESMAKMIEANPLDGVWSIDEAPTKRAINKQTGLVETMAIHNWTKADNVVPFKRDGVTHYMRFEGEHGPAIARALNGLEVGDAEKLVMKLGAVTRGMARLATTYNPAFGPFNFIRDFKEAFINIGEQGLRTKLIKNLPGAFMGSFQELAGLKGGKWADAFREMDREGGRVRFMNLENAEVNFKRIQREFEAARGNPIQAGVQAVRKFGRGLEFVNDIFENSTRVAAYKSFRDAGMTPAKAAFEARELTLNFTRKGEWGSALSSVYMFANANIQGTARMGRALKQPGVQKTLAVGATGVGLLTYYNVMHGGRDEDGKTFYSKIPPWVRNNNFIFMNPKGDGGYFAVPAPFGFGAIKNAVERGVETAIDPRVNKMDQAGEVLSGTVDAFNPLGSDKNWFVKATPSVLKPAAQLAFNEKFSGAPINPDYDNKKFKNKPDSEKAFRSANPYAVQAAEKLNEVTGGNKKQSGAIDISPGTIEHVIGAVTGGLGSTVWKTVGAIKKSAQGIEVEQKDIPVLNRFGGKVGFPETQAQYFKEKTAVEHATVQEIKGPEAKAAGIFKAADKQRTAINKQVDRVKADSALSPKERDVKLKELEKQMGASMKRALIQLERYRGSENVGESQGN